MPFKTKRKAEDLWAKRIKVRDLQQKVLPEDAQFLCRVGPNEAYRVGDQVYLVDPRTGEVLQSAYDKRARVRVLVAAWLRQAVRNEPLKEFEDLDVGKANMWIMDWEMDGGTLPREVQRVHDLRRKLKPDEQRVILKWFWSTAPGDYS